MPVRLLSVKNDVKCVHVGFSGRGGGGGGVTSTRISGVLCLNRHNFLDFCVFRQNKVRVGSCACRIN